MRRTVFAMILGLLCCVSSGAQDEGVRLERAYQLLDQYVRQEMRLGQAPGMAIALTSREGLLRVSTYGYADIKTRRPVTPDTLFEIGSISKGFTAITLLQLQEQGRVDLQGPVKKYLPWFDVQSTFAPITIHHLLTHTAGIPRDRDDIPSSVYQAAALRFRTTGYAPGKKFAYSNIGYQVLGYLVERLTGEPYAKALRERILDPLGMNSTQAAITSALRKHMAVGYTGYYDDRPHLSSDGLVEATWLEYGAGDGSIVATPADLATYVRMLLNRGAASHSRILSEKSFEQFTQKAIRTGDSYYGYGIRIRKEDGHTILSHGGGMVGYTAFIVADLDAGVGAVELVNGPGVEPRITDYALKLLRAALHKAELPPVPPPPQPARVEKAAEYAGTYTAAVGRSLVFEAQGDALFLLHDGKKVGLLRRGPNRFVVPEDDFRLFPLVFGRAKAAEGSKPGPVVEVFYGSDWYAGRGYSGPRSFSAPKEWAAYPGHYRSYSPWLSNFRILLRKGKLFVAFPEGGEEPLLELGPGEFQVGGGETAERLRVDSVVDGKALRANLSGVDFYRSFLP